MSGHVGTWLLVLCLCIGLPGSSVVDGLRILGVFPMHGKSHFVICERLMRGLAERGHQVDVYSHFPLKKPPPNYTDYSLQGSMPTIVNNMTFQFMNMFTSGGEVQSIAEIIGRPICNLLHLPIMKKLLDNPPNNPPYDVVIVEIFMSPCYLALGRHFNIPMVNVVPSVLFDWMYEPVGNPINLAVDSSVFSQSTSLETFTDRITNLYRWHQIKWSYNHYTEYQNDIVKEVFGPGYPSVRELQKDPSLTLVNYNQALNGNKPFTPAVVPVGGLSVFDTDDDLPPKVKKFLDESKDGFVYVSFGSMVRIETFPKADVEAFYATFKKIAPVRVLMKIAVPDELPPGIPSNVLTHTWLPQVKVLKHKNIKAFITHGGLMGTLEAVYHGVPMIGFPLFGDQYLNIELYVRKNIAIQLDRNKITESSFTKAVFEILKNPLYKKSAEKIGKAFRDVPMSPMDTAAFWIEYVVRHGKDALRSPIVDMPWWQVNLLDVYGFIGTIAFIGLFMIKMMLSKFIRLFSTKRPPHSSNSKTKIKNN